MTSKKLLVVVDYQKDFVDGSLGFEGARLIEQPLCDKIRAALAAGYDLVFTMDTHEQKYLLTAEGRHLPVKHCIRGTAGWALYGKVAAFADRGRIIEKPTFGSTELGAFIRDGGYSSVELCGVVSNICVISNAVIAKSASPESTIIVDARCIASNDPTLQKEAIDIMRNLHIEVTGCD